MSKVKIQGNASGTGVVTLTAPNTNTDRTITLPDSTGSILDSTSTLDATKLSGALPAIDGSALTNLPGGGKVLQVVTATDTTATSTTGTSFVATGLSASITPSSTSSKILAMSSQDWYIYGNDATTRAYTALYRDSTMLKDGQVGEYISGTSYISGSTSHIVLDSPSTTSSVTYSTKLRVHGVNTTIFTESDSRKGTITLMEIGA